MPPSTNALESHLTPQLDRSRDFFWHRLRWRAVRRYVPAGTPFRLVDVGAGAGLLGEYLAAERPEVEYRYLEPIASLEETLERRFGPQANARELARYEGARLVTLLDVLEHQQDDVSFLSDLVARMEVGSRLILTVPAMPSLWSSWDESLGHYRRYTRASLTSATSRLPLRRIEMNYLFPEMVPAALLRRRRRPAGGSERAASADVAFPELPTSVNRAMYACGALTQCVRQALPIGTSLFAALERHGDR